MTEALITNFDQLMSATQHVDIKLAQRLISSPDKDVQQSGHQYMARAKANCLLFVSLVDHQLHHEKPTDSEVCVVLEELRTAAIAVADASTFDDLKAKYNSAIMSLEDLCVLQSPELIDALGDAV